MGAQKFMGAQKLLRGHDASASLRHPQMAPVIWAGASPAADLPAGQQLQFSERDRRLVWHGRTCCTRDRPPTRHCPSAPVHRTLGRRSRWRPRWIPASDPRQRTRDPLRRLRRSAQHPQHHRRTGGKRRCLLKIVNSEASPPQVGAYGVN